MHINKKCYLLLATSDRLVEFFPLVKYVAMSKPEVVLFLSSSQIASTAVWCMDV